MREFAKVFEALSGETRLRILKLLRECCVCEVMQALDISQTRASRNLNALYDAGCPRLRKDRLLRSFYSIDEERVHGYMAELVEAVREGFAGNDQAAPDLEWLRRAERVGPHCASKLPGTIEFDRTNQMCRRSKSRLAGRGPDKW